MFTVRAHLSNVHGGSGPFAPDENIFSRGTARHILWVGLLMGVVSLLAGLFGGTLTMRPGKP